MGDLVEQVLGNTAATSAMETGKNFTLVTEPRKRQKIKNYFTALAENPHYTLKPEARIWLKAHLREDPAFYMITGVSDEEGQSILTKLYKDSPDKNPPIKEYEFTGYDPKERALFVTGDKITRAMAAKQGLRPS